MDPRLKEDLMKKYGLGGYGNEERDALVAANQEAANPALAALSGFGAGIAGRDVGSAFNTALNAQQAGTREAIDAFDQGRQQERADFDFTRNLGKMERDEAEQVRLAGLQNKENDPSSQESMLAQQIASKMLPSKDFSGMSAAEINKMLPSISKIYEGEQSRQSRESIAKENAASRAALAQENAAARAALAAEKTTKMAEEKAAKPTEGIKTLDRTFAKEYDDWTSVGKPQTEKNLQLLQNAINTLEKRKDDWVGTSGRLTGRIPDILRSEESLRIRDDVQQAAQSSLKATLGPAFTEKEGENIMKRAYNENVSPEENIKKIKTAIRELQQAALNKEAKALYFEENGTLAGFRPDADKENTVKVLAPNGKVALIKKENLEAALKGGGKLLNEGSMSASY